MSEPFIRRETTTELVIVVNDRKVTVPLERQTISSPVLKPVNPFSVPVKPVESVRSDPDYEDYPEFEVLNRFSKMWFIMVLITHVRSNFYKVLLSFFI